jgi:acyl-CoA synthetase (AMP-forming)/AMP-acid ligase II
VTSAANTIVELIACQSRRTPDALAILAPGRSPLTYRGLTQRIDDAIAALAAAGVGRGDRVALAVPNGPEMAVALIAVMGCAECAPLSLLLDEAAYLVALRTLHVDVLVVLDGGDTPVVRVAQALTLPVIRLAVLPHEPAGSFCLIANLSRPRAVVAVPELGDVALVLQTSGTTAQPKVVPITHGNLAAGALARARHVRHTSVDRCLCVAPLYSGMAIRRCLVPVLVSGGSVVCAPGYDANLFFAWLDEFEPTFYMAVPAFHRAVLDENERRGGTPPPALRFIGSESATLPVDMERRLEATFGVPVVQGYGLTETGLIAQTPLPPGHRRAGSVGIAVDGEIAVLAGDHRRIPSDQPGEILVRGAAVFGGYEDNPEANQEAFHDGWFRTGDRGTSIRTVTCSLSVAQGIINRGGTAVSPTAVDAALRASRRL